MGVLTIGGVEGIRDGGGGGFGTKLRHQDRAKAAVPQRRSLIFAESERLGWGIEEWHRILKSGCRVEKREFKSAQNLQRVLAFDLIVAWRVIACLKAGRTRHQIASQYLRSAQK